MLETSSKELAGWIETRKNDIDVIGFTSEERKACVIYDDKDVR